MTQSGPAGDEDASQKEVKKLPACDPGELRSLFLFEKLTDDQLATLCHAGHVELIQPGPVFAEGADATCLYVLLDGTLVTSRNVQGDDVELARTSMKGVYAGAFQAYAGDLVPQLYLNSMRVTTPTRFFVLEADTFARIMREWFPMAVHLLEGLITGGQAMRETIDRRERLQALGALTAGLTHELNNPAAAAVRATASLRERVSGMRGKMKIIAKASEQGSAPGQGSAPDLHHGKARYQTATLQSLIALQESAVEKVAKAPKLDPLATSDAEDEVTDWLDDNGISEGWRLAPTFVQAGLTTEWLGTVKETVGGEGVEPAIRWLNYTVETELLMTEIEDATNRISSLVGAARQYSQLDRAPFQVADVHDLLDSTLMMLSAKIAKAGITVDKEYDRALPPVPCYPGELNQVWTNLIDNAVDAMNGPGTLTVRTGRDSGDCVVVEFGDTGPGVPAGIQHRIFEPFFTTKPVGRGTGLGLDISYRIVVNKHHGDLRVTSVPGDTRFQVILPINQTQNGSGSS
ncbi:MAG TPA: ATP-binding protein [Trebonia sp.]|jgi:signal transduction histidine kinase|nr:ATP-binding protein [Trebonia sp.]